MVNADYKPKTSDFKLTIYLRNKLAQLFPTPIINFLLFFYKPYKKFRMPEVKTSFGDLYPDRTFYLIRIYPPGTGYLGNYNYVLGYMNYAYQKGWIPVIDMYHYDTVYTPHNIEQDVPVDMWGAFFEQPWDEIHQRRYSLEEVYNSKNVVLSCGSEDFCDYSFLPENISWQRKMMKQIPFIPYMQKYAEGMLNTTIGENNRPVIGMPLRGTDYKQHYAGHSIQLDVSEAYKYYKIYKEKWYPNSELYVYCNSEEQKTVDDLKKGVPNVISSRTHRLSEYSSLNVSDALNQGNKFEMLRDYLANMYVLSKCDSLIGTMNNGFYTAFLWSDGKYEHFDCIDLGTNR